MEESEQKLTIPQLVIQVAELPDAGIDVEGTIPFADLELDGDGRFDLEGVGIRYRLHVAQVKPDVYVTGTLEADIQAMCDRCTEWAPLHLSEPEVFHCYEDVNDEPVDITEDIREDVVLMFPDSFHCSESCKGICPICGQNLNEGECGCDRTSTWDEEESPWAALPNLEDSPKK